MLAAEFFRTSPNLSSIRSVLCFVQDYNEIWHQAVRYTVAGDAARLEETLLGSPDLDANTVFNETFVSCVEYGLPATVFRRVFKASLETPAITLMHLAARNNQVDIMRLLAKYGAEADCIGAGCYDKHGHTPLFEAVSRGHFEAVRYLLDAGASAKWPTGTGKGMLHACMSQTWSGAPAEIREGRIEMVKLMLEHDAPVLEPTPISTPLVALAIRLHDIDIIKALVRQGASCKGTLPAFVREEASEEMLDFLIANGADGVLGIFPRSDRAGSRRHISLVLDRYDWSGERKGVQNEVGWAACRGDVELAEFLLSRPGIDVNGMNEADRSPLHEAIFGRQAEMVRRLVEWGADVNQPVVRRDMREFPLASPLRLAVALGELSSAGYLLAAGANPDGGAGDVVSPLMYLCYGQGYWLPDDEHEALRLVDMFLDHHSRIRTELDNGRSALHLLATCHQHGAERAAHLARALLQRGMDPHVRTDAGGETPVELALREQAASAQAASADLDPLIRVLREYMSEHTPDEAQPEQVPR